MGCVVHCARCVMWCGVCDAIYVGCCVRCGVWSVCCIYIALFGVMRCVVHACCMFGYEGWIMVHGGMRGYIWRTLY